MLILSNVLPAPLQGQVRADSQIWQCAQQFERSRRYFVSAASGKGKTTLQHIFYGLRHDYSGGVLIDSAAGKFQTGKISSDEWAIIRTKVLSVIFQDLRLFAELSVGENLLIKNQLTDFKTESEIKAMLAFLEVDSFWDKKAGLLSYGQRQRVAIVRALLQPFEWLLMDEPFAHLDTENIRKACTLISDACKAQNAGFLLASLGDRYFLEYDFELHL